MKLWKSAMVVLLFAWLVYGAWSQSQPQPSADNKNVDDVGVQVHDQSNDQKGDQNHDPAQTAPARNPPAPETIVSPK